MPQIFNAIKGEMSLVGSRTYLDRKMGDAVNTIILAKSGITGYWQVNRHSNVLVYWQLEFLAGFGTVIKNDRNSFR